MKNHPDESLIAAGTHNKTRHSREGGTILKKCFFVTFLRKSYGSMRQKWFDAEKINFFTRRAKTF